jgi:protein-S-isoprenylcysteine O-methyltransferase Ste14
MAPQDRDNGGVRTPPKPRLLRKAWRHTASTVVFLAVVLFATAGTLRWPAAWAVLLLWTGWTVLATVWLARNDPALLKERLNTRLIQEGQKEWDKVVSVIFVALSVPMIALPGLDAVRNRWTQAPPVLEAAGFIGLLAALGLVLRVFQENSYAARTVKIDVVRGHHAITTGPYEVVRHPMYVGAIVACFSWALALGSLLTLIPAGLTSLVFVVRTSLEDRTLRKELPGYEAYAHRTRYRLLPGVW